MKMQEDNNMQKQITWTETKMQEDNKRTAPIL